HLHQPHRLRSGADGGASVDRRRCRQPELAGIARHPRSHLSRWRGTQPWFPWNPVCSVPGGSRSKPDPEPQAFGRGFPRSVRAAARHETQEMFAKQNRGDNPKDHKIIYGKTFKLMGSSTLNAFKIDQEPEAVRTKYGTSGFAKNCLLARRLVEIGVPFIEVGF